MKLRFVFNESLPVMLTIGEQQLKAVAEQAPTEALLTLLAPLPGPRQAMALAIAAQFNRQMPSASIRLLNPGSRSSVAVPLAAEGRGPTFGDLVAQLSGGGHSVPSAHPDVLELEISEIKNIIELVVDGAGHPLSFRVNGEAPKAKSRVNSDLFRLIVALAEATSCQEWLTYEQLRSSLWDGIHTQIDRAPTIDARLGDIRKMARGLLLEKRDATGKRYQLNALVKRCRS